MAELQNELLSYYRLLDKKGNETTIERKRKKKALEITCDLSASKQDSKEMFNNFHIKMF